MTDHEVIKRPAHKKFREPTANDPIEMGVFAHTSRLGEVVQKIADDPDVISFKIIPTSAGGEEWFVTAKFAVVNLEARQNEIAQRLFHTLDDNMTFRIISEK